MAVLCWMNTIQYSPRSAVCNRCFPGPTRVLDANGISIAAAVLPGSLSDRPTDHAIRSLRIGGAQSGEAKFCYFLRIQQVLIGAVDWTDRINFRNQQLYSAVRQDGTDGLQCMWRYTTKRAFPTGVLDRWQFALLYLCLFLMWVYA